MVASRVAEQLEQDTRERTRRLHPAERVALALALGRAAIATHAAAHGLDINGARQKLELAAQKGRRVSRVMRDAIG